jgi:PEP-CTERM motif
MDDGTKTETSREKEAVKDAGLVTEPQQVLYAKTSDPGVTIGVVTDSEPSSLTLLAAGVAGMAARRARRERTK